VRAALEVLNADEGTTLLVTSHDMNEVERLCERVVFLQRGRVVHDGTPADILSQHGHASLEDVFLHLAAEQP
jgi:ABC-2 type transport system ATP-binding protein